MKKVSIILVLFAYNMTSFGSWVNTKDWDQRMWTNQLLWCVGRGSVGDCQRALSRGAQVNKKDDKGRTPLMWAIHHRQFKVAKLLLENKAHVGIKDDQGRTALHRASSAGLKPIIMLLLKYNANPDLLDQKDETSLDKVVFCSKNRSAIDSLWTICNAEKLSKCWSRIAKKTDSKMFQCILSRGLPLSELDLKNLLPVHKQCIADRSRAITDILDLIGSLPTVLIGVVQVFLAKPEQLRIIESMKQQYPKCS